MGRAARSERARPHRGPGDDQTVRHPSRLCHLARVGDSVTRPRQPLHTLFSDQLASPEEPHTFFSQMVLTSSSLLPVLLSLPLVWPDLPDFPSGSAWLSLTDQRLALPQARCASRTGALCMSFARKMTENQKLGLVSITLGYCILLYLASYCCSFLRLLYHLLDEDCSPN